MVPQGSALWREGEPLPCLHPPIQGFQLSGGPGAICSIPAHIKAHSRRAASAAPCSQLSLPHHLGTRQPLGDAWHGTRLTQPPFMSARLRLQQLVFKAPWKLPHHQPVSWTILWVRSLADKF